MVKRLYIKNFATVELLTIDFGDNLNILSGETGAGKSIIIESINFLFGKTKGVDIIRSGEEEAYISCLFSIEDQEAMNTVNSIIAAGGLTPEDDGILIKRVVNIAGKSRYFINNEPANKIVIGKISEYLVNIFGQNDKKFLISEESQLALLDDYAGNSELLTKIKELYKNINRLKSEKIDLENKASNISRLKTINSYIITDVERLSIASDKDEENIKEELTVLENINKIKEYILTAKDLIDNEETGALKNLNSVITGLEKLGGIDRYFKDSDELKNACNAKILLEDILISLEKRSSIEFDEEKLNALKTKLDLIISVESKYNCRNLKELLGAYEQAKNEMEGISDLDERIKELLKQIEYKISAYLNIAALLNKKRIESALRLEKAISGELLYLGIKPVFRIDIAELLFENGFSDTGLNRCAFIFSANPGENPKPLSMIASGGELSRLSLCMLKVVNSEKNAGSLIFDEIDAGIGGEVANYVGNTLKKISEKTQVICITHLAQVASCAQKHFLISKTVKGGRTFTLVKDLDIKGRILEIARMLSGDETTETAVNHAKEILQRRGFIV